MMETTDFEEVVDMDADMPEVIEGMAKDVSESFNKKPGVNRGRCCWKGGLTCGIVIAGYGLWQMYKAKKHID